MGKEVLRLVSESHTRSLCAVSHWRKCTANSYIMKLVSEIFADNQDSDNGLLCRVISSQALLGWVIYKEAAWRAQFSIRVPLESITR